MAGIVGALGNLSGVWSVLVSARAAGTSIPECRGCVDGGFYNLVLDSVTVKIGLIGQWP
jgi:hypothetical protein